MSRALALALATALSSCTLRAPIPPPHEPLVGTPAAALPPPPEGRWEEAPLALRLTRYTLPNGFRLVIARGEPNGVASVAFVSAATPRWDRRAPAVVTEWMAHLMLRATGADREVVDDLLSREGFAPALELGAVGIRLSDTMPREELPRFVRALDRTLREPAFRPEDLARRVESYSDRAELELAGAAGLLDDRAPSLLYHASDPRAEGTRARLAALATLDVEALAARHADLLDPSRSALVVTGDVEPQLVLPFLGQVFGAWPARPAPSSGPELVPPRLADPSEPRARVVVRPALRAYLRLVERAPPFPHPDYAAFLVLEQLLGGMFASRLNLAVRERTGASYGFHARFGASATEGAIEMETAVDPPYTRAVLDAMLAEVRRVRGERGGVEAGELAIAKARARELLLARLDSSLGLAHAIARRIQIGQEPGATGDVLRRIDALDERAVEAAARAWLRPDRAPLLLVVRPEHLGAIEAAGLGTIEVVRPREGR
ncbi:MAG: insulinase family protein [Sandaracinaceae bacterium]|nr:insulinase family protein [Sandaracinaceae bacterium]